MTEPTPDVGSDEPSEATAASDVPAEPAPPADPTEATAPVEPEIVEPTLEEQLAERTSDLQRLQAEYINYKRRVDRDRVLIRAQGEATVLRSLLTVLDDIGRADEHGELVGGFKAVADSLQTALKGHKLEAFGAKGEPFDPVLHEAMFHAGHSSEVTTTTVDSVLRTGYRVGEDVIRHAQVAVVDPPEDEPVEPTPPVEPVETTESVDNHEQD